MHRWGYVSKCGAAGWADGDEEGSIFMAKQRRSKTNLVSTSRHISCELPRGGNPKSLPLHEVRRTRISTETTTVRFGDDEDSQGS